MNTVRNSFYRNPAQILWLALVLLQVIVLVVGMPDWFEALKHPCSASATECGARMQLTPHQAARWSMDAYAWFIGGERVLARMFGLVLGVLVFVRKPGSRIARITSLYLIIGLETSISSSLGISRPAWLPVVLALQFVGEISLVMFLLLFPKEQFIPRWTRGIPWLYAVLSAALSGLWLVLIRSDLAVDAAERVESIRLGLGLVLLVVLLVLVGIFIYRYRRVLRPEEQLQARWVIFAFAISYGAFAGLILSSYAAGFEIGAASPTAFILQSLVINVLPDFLIPAAIAIAILRHHLFEIDVLIRRTLSYTLLTGVLAAVYFGAVVLLQFVFRSLTGATDSPLVTVVSTLTIAALFNPLHASIQSFIDRRFYRAKYNAWQTLERFAATARDEVDMDALSTAVIGVVKETMQPIRTSLWLRQPAGDRS